VSVPIKHLLQHPLDIIFENNDLLAVNKPVGIAVHGEDSLDTLIQTYLEGRRQAASSPISLSFRSGPLHRLDQPTSGIVVFSKSLAGARLFSSLIQEHRLVKRYLALVDGCLNRAEMWEDALVRDKAARKTFAASGTASDPPPLVRDTVATATFESLRLAAHSGLATAIPLPVSPLSPSPPKAAAKSAQTRITPLAATTRCSLICAEIGTGRTHQIRAQAALHGHPLSGDKKYNGSFQKGGLLLHAWKLDFPPETGIPPLAAPLPKAFQKRIREIFGEGILKISANG
jgi:23S rRNA pseudouridine955/2504/2580 synthase